MGDDSSSCKLDWNRVQDNRDKIGINWKLIHDVDINLIEIETMETKYQLEADSSSCYQLYWNRDKILIGTSIKQNLIEIETKYQLGADSSSYKLDWNKA